MFKVLFVRNTISVYLYAKWAILSPRIFHETAEASVFYPKATRLFNVGYIDDSYLQGRDYDTVQIQ